MEGYLHPKFRLSVGPVIGIRQLCSTDEFEARKTINVANDAIPNAAKVGIELAASNNHSHPGTGFDENTSASPMIKAKGRAITIVPNRQAVPISHAAKRLLIVPCFAQIAISNGIIKTINQSPSGTCLLGSRK
jgi:hypothetical protein